MARRVTDIRPQVLHSKRDIIKCCATTGKGTVRACLAGHWPNAVVRSESEVTPYLQRPFAMLKVANASSATP